MEFLFLFSLMFRSAVLSCLIIIAAASAAPAGILRPPPGNSPFLTVEGKGVQIYRCNRREGRLEYILDGAKASLHSVEQLGNSSPVLGSHYFLPRPDAGGGRATWSIVTTLADDAWSTPSSTATFGVIASRPSTHRNSIASLLLRATSHSGDGALSQASYVQRLNCSGGLSPRYCSEGGEKLEVPYHSYYVFWTQIRAPPEPPMIPQSLTLPEGHTLLISYFAQGFLTHKFNGTSWRLQNSSAALSSLPGDPVVGMHDFLPVKDSKGGQLSWNVFTPPSRVTVKVVRQQKMGGESMPWSLLKATSHIGESYFLGSVSYVHCVFTTGGLPPTRSTAVGSSYTSPYTAIYFFYVPLLR